jgi:hypothetical protein
VSRNGNSAVDGNRMRRWWQHAGREVEEAIDPVAESVDALNQTMPLKICRDSEVAPAARRPTWRIAIRAPRQLHVLPRRRRTGHSSMSYPVLDTVATVST